MPQLLLAPPTDREYWAIERLSRTEDFQQFLFYLRRCLSEQDHSNRHSKGEDVVRGQGMALTFEGLIDLIETAPTVSNKIRSTQA